MNVYYAEKAISSSTKMFWWGDAMQESKYLVYILDAQFQNVLSIPVLNYIIGQIFSRNQKCIFELFNVKYINIEISQFWII